MGCVEARETVSLGLLKEIVNLASGALEPVLALVLVIEVLTEVLIGTFEVLIEVLIAGWIGPRWPNELIF